MRSGKGGALPRFALSGELAAPVTLFYNGTGKRRKGVSTCVSDCVSTRVYLLLKHEIPLVLPISRTSRRTLARKHGPAFGGACEAPSGASRFLLARAPP